jgi:adenine-specific DNA-methyltransferase
MKPNMTPLSNARNLRRGQTEAEQKLWAQLRDRRLQGYKFRRQVPLGRFIVDFSCYDERLVIELDGVPHADEERQARDRDRTRWLESHDFTVLRFWNSEVLGNMDGVLLRILERLEQR